MPRKLPTGYTELTSGAIRWRVSVNGVRYTGTQPDLPRARRARAQAEANAGGTPEARPTAGELIDIYVATADRARATTDGWKWAIEYLPDTFLERIADDVTPQIVAWLWRQLADIPTHARVKIRNVCSGAWQDGIMLGLVTGNPWTAVKPPSTPPSRRVVPPTEDDVRRLIDAAAGRRLALWLRVASRIGTRAGELCAIRWDDLDPQRGLTITRNVTRRGEITIGKANGKSHRVVPLDLPIMTALAKSRTTEPVVSPWVWTHDGTEPWRPDYVATAMRRLCDKIGVDISPHDLRHFAVTQWLGDGVPIPTVATLIGDNPQTVLKTYAHWVPQQGREAVEMLGRRLDGV